MGAITFELLLLCLVLTWDCLCCTIRRLQTCPYNKPISDLTSRMSGTIIKRMNPLCSCANARSIILCERRSVAYNVCSQRSIVRIYSLAGLGRDISTTPLFAASTEAGIAGEFTSTDSTATKPIKEKKIPKKGKLIRRKPTTAHTNQKVRGLLHNYTLRY